MKLRLPVVAVMFLAGCASQQQPLGSSDTYNRLLNLFNGKNETSGIPSRMPLQVD